METARVRIAALIAAAVLWATLSSAAPAAALTIGTPPEPPQTTSRASLRAYYQARLASQATSYESQLAAQRKQLAAVKKQLATAKKQKTAAGKSIVSLKAQLKSLRSSATNEQISVSELTAENETLKSEYAPLIRTRNAQSYQIDELKAKIRPPIYLDPLAWLALAAGSIGVLVGLRVGFNRGQSRFYP